MVTEISATIYGLWNNNFTGSSNVILHRAGMFFRNNGFVYKTNNLNKSSTSLDSSATFQVDTLYHIVCIYDSLDNAQIYINGSLDNSGSDNGNSLFSDTLSIGVRTGLSSLGGKDGTSSSIAKR